MPNSLTAAFNQLKRLLRTPPATNTQSPFPPTRNFVLDILAEGRRKNTIQLLLDVDATAIRAQIARVAEQSGNRISITSYVAGVLARTVAASPIMHAYLHKRRKLVMFADVDLSVMIEREVDGASLPLPFIIRAANQKSFAEIKMALAQAKSAEFYADGPLSALESKFFSMPRALRKVVWYFARRDAHLFRELAGTVGITSMGMHAIGRAIVIPITPMTLTLSIGAIYAHPAIIGGSLIEKEMLQLNLSADHDIIDGAPLMRFATRFKENLEHGIP